MAQKWHGMDIHPNPPPSLVCSYKGIKMNAWVSEGEGKVMGQNRGKRKGGGLWSNRGANGKHQDPHPSHSLAAGGGCGHMSTPCIEGASGAKGG